MAEEGQVLPPTEKPKSKYKLFVIIGVIVLVVLLAGGAFYILNSRNSSSAPEGVTPTPTNSPAPKTEATFSCKQDKTIIAIFNNDTDGSVDLALSDGKNINLPRAESASGARYANEDESVVFWNSGNDAFLEENGVQTYTDCVAPPSS